MALCFKRSPGRVEIGFPTGFFFTLLAYPPMLTRGQFGRLCLYTRQRPPLSGFVLTSKPEIIQQGKPGGETGLDSLRNQAFALTTGLLV
jgi:hypothetical protein